MNYHNITYPDMNNGDGLRVVLWLSGCSHHCNNCQNPQTWDKDSGVPFDEKTKEELFRELDKDYISGLTLTGGDPLFKENLNGVLDIIKEFNKRYKNDTTYMVEKNDKHNILNENDHEIRLSLPNKTIWLYTGFKWEDITMKLGEVVHSHNGLKFTRSLIVEDCDVLVDGQYVDELQDFKLKWRGSSNQRVIDIKKSLEQNKVVLHCD